MLIWQLTIKKLRGINYFAPTVHVRQTLLKDFLVKVREKKLLVYQ